MPPVAIRSTCSEGTACLTRAYVNGGALRVLHPSVVWFGECRAPTHTPECAQFFNGATFSVPIATSAAMLSRSTPAAERMFASMTATPADALSFASLRSARRSIWTARAVDILERGAPPPPAGVLRAYVASCSPCRRVLRLAFPPAPLSCVVDVAHVGAYKRFVEGSARMPRGHHPPTDAAVDAVVARLPPELRPLVLRHVYVACP